LCFVSGVFYEPSPTVTRSCRCLCYCVFRAPLHLINFLLSLWVRQFVIATIFYILEVYFESDKNCLVQFSLCRKKLQLVKLILNLWVSSELINMTGIFRN
jgi:hypothetical protein